MRKFIILVAMMTAVSFVLAGDLDWPEPEIENRPGCYWWWMGSAVDRENITWNLETMRKAGMGGATIVPIYGAKGYKDRYIQHLSPEFVDMVEYAVAEGGRLGMWIDMTTGTGWPFGGPMISDDDCDAKVVYKGDGKVAQKFSGRYVKRAAPGNVGKGINPYSPGAMERYLEHFETYFDLKGSAGPRAHYHDSFEFKGNWTRELPDEFKKRRGYDLIDHLPELFGKGKKQTEARIKCDYSETISDLHLEYIEVWAKWAEARGATTRNQAHGSPANLLDVYAASGIPETETFGSTPFKIPGIRREPDNVRKKQPQPLINRMASSAAHVAGKPLVASETCTWIRNHFRSALSQVKPEIDQLFLNGINHIFFHGTCYSPKDARWPGWLFYASLQYNPRNSIWRDSQYLNAYITRCQSILQSGKPDNDVALYWPVHDLWSKQKRKAKHLSVRHSGWMTKSPAGKTAQWLKDNGYGFDFISDRQLLADKAKPYSAVIVPKTIHLPLETAKKLMALSQNGKPVIFIDSIPQDVPGFYKFKERRKKLSRLFKDHDGLVAVPMTALKQRLSETEVIREPMTDSGIDFIRRTHDEGCHYFVANMSDKPVDEWIVLGKKFDSAVIMDAYTGRTGVSRKRGNKLYLQLLPGETRIIRTFEDKTVSGDKWPVLAATEDNPLTVTGEWTVSFVDGGPNLPSSFKTTKLGSWTEQEDDEAKRFAGTARYSIEFDLPDIECDEWVIDLGDVRESARVIINGEMAGALYSIPYKTAVGHLLKPGKNKLEIEVTNLTANRIRDLDIRKVRWKIFKDINFKNLNYRKFDASVWPLTPSGLLGPVRLKPMKKMQLNTVRQLDWSKLEGGAGDDELAAISSTVMEHTQEGMGELWLDKVKQTKQVGDLLDFGYIQPETKRKRRAMEDAIRSMTTLSRTLALAIRTGQYRAEEAGADANEIERLLPLVIRSIATDHKVNGGIGKHVWGDSWQSAMWAGQLATTAWIIWDRLSQADQKLVMNVLIHESNRYLKVKPPVSNEDSVIDTKAEENKWNAGCLLTAAAMLRGHPNEEAWREQAIVYLLNAVATPHDLKSEMIVDGKPLSERLRGYCFTKDYAVGNHKFYPHPGYTSAGYMNMRSILFYELAGVQVPEALLYNAAPIYRMFVDHSWKAPPCTSPGGTIYKKDSGIYWPIEKEPERAGRYYIWFRQDVQASTFGYDKACSTKAAHWAKLHGQIMVDALTGKPTPVPLEAYHKGAFFKTSLTSYLIRVLHVNSQLAPVRSMYVKGGVKN